MKIFSGEQIKKWDSFTIANEPIPSVELMERAAKACADWIFNHYNASTPFRVFCGKGNNGGDGLAISRLLLQNQYDVTVYIVETGKPGSGDFQINLDRLENTGAAINFIRESSSFPQVKNEGVIIDALFGTGLHKKPAGIYEAIIIHLNNSGAAILSIDMPSGLFTDKSSTGNTIIRATCTLSFQQLKVAFLLAENESFCGKTAILDIGLSKEFYASEPSRLSIPEDTDIGEIYVPRKAFANKGNFGYACLVAGSYGMMGAAVMSAKACLRAGVGKLTVFTCKDGYDIMQTTVPEAMCRVYGNTCIKDIESIKTFDAVGIGPGIGIHLSHKQLLQKVFRNARGPLVLDADALNVLSTYPALHKSIPPKSILTPHPKEFERLFGKSKSDFERMEEALKRAAELDVFIVLKGHYTFIATPGGKGYFNATGNAGMATAGSGDVLTGILIALLAQQYNSLNACLLGVYLHGLAGDIAAEKFSKEAMIAGDIIENLGEGFIRIADFRSPHS